MIDWDNEMASSIVTSAAQQLGTLLVPEGKYLYEVSDKIENLQSVLEWMQCFLEDADNRQHQEKVVRKWVAEIRDFAYEAEDLIERLQIYGIQIIRQTEGSTYNLALREQRRTYSHIEEKTIGLENHIKELVDKLTNENEASVVGISGIGGLGKTTLARKVYSDKKVAGHFKNCVWVYISKQFERRSVFEEILIGLSCSGKDNDARKKIRELTNEELPGKMCKVLKEDCLVILDDIWSNEAWDTLKPAFESTQRSGSKVLITTRNMELVRYADPSGYTHPLGILSEEDAWKLIQQTAFLEEHNTAAEVKAEMDKLGKAMLKHCKGLPLVIVALGGILAAKRTNEGSKAI